MLGLRQGAVATQLLFLLFYELGCFVQGQTENQKNDGLEAGDYAAIGLGILLAVVSILIIFLCILYKKGCIGKKPEPQVRVTPETPVTIGGFSTSPERIKARTLEAIAIEQQRKSRRIKNDQQPTFYIFDDIYHPPKSRPLPTDSPIPNGKPAAHVHTSKQKRTKMSKNKTHDKLKQNTEKIVKERRPRKSKAPQSRDQGDASFSSSKTVSVNGHLIFPDNGRINFTTHFEKSEPYKF